MMDGPLTLSPSDFEVPTEISGFSGNRTAKPWHKATAAVEQASAAATNKPRIIFPYT